MKADKDIKKRNQVKRFSIGTAGGFLLIVGIIAIPYPGPGWLIVISALAILATEFDWAKNLLSVVKTRYDAWEEWMKQQGIFVRSIFWLFTCAVVIVTIWLLNGYGLINDWFKLGLDWVNSPLL